MTDLCQSISDVHKKQAMLQSQQIASVLGLLEVEGDNCYDILRRTKYSRVAAVDVTAAIYLVLPISWVVCGVHGTSK